MVEQILFSLLITLAVELFIYGFADRFNHRSYIMMFVINIILNVTMNVVLLSINNYQTYLIILIIAEVLVFIIESITFYLFAKKKLWFSFLIGFTANITSLAVGNTFNYFKVIENAIAFYILICVFMFIVSIQIGIVLYFYIIKKRSGLN